MLRDILFDPQKKRALTRTFSALIGSAPILMGAPVMAEKLTNPTGGSVAFVNRKIARDDPGQLRTLEQPARFEHPISLGPLIVPTQPKHSIKSFNVMRKRLDVVAADARAHGTPIELRRLRRDTIVATGSDHLYDDSPILSIDVEMNF